MRLTRFLAAFAALAAALVGAPAAMAQATGGLRVRVIDAGDKSAIPGAYVTLSNEQQLVAPTRVATDADGIVLFPVLRLGGGYVIEVQAEGYATIRMPDLRVEGGGKVKDIPIALIPEQSTQVTVIAERATVDLEKTRTSTTFSDEFINDLPVEGRYYQNVLVLAPGVQDADGDGNPNVNGARSRDFKAQVSGVSNQDPLTGNFLSFVNADSIEEIEVVTAGAGVEYGRAVGGFANIVQKQGTNDFEGVVNFLYSSSRLDAHPETSIPNELLPQYTQVQPSVSLSGPILKDKMWYRLSHEYRGLELPANLGSSVEVSNYTQWIHDDQVTWQISPRNKVDLQFRNDPTRQTNVGVSALVPAESTNFYTAKSPTYQVRWTAPYSPNLFVENSVAYQDFTLEFKPTTVGVPNRCMQGLGYLTAAQCFNAETGEISGSSGYTYMDRRQRLSVYGNAEYFKSRLWGMSHRFRVGYEIANERFYQEETDLPTITFLTIRPEAATNPNDPNQEKLSLRSIIISDLRIPEGTNYAATGTTWAIYGNDSLRPLNNLTFDVGLRIDREQINSTGFEPFYPREEAAKSAITGSDERQFFTVYEGIAELPEQLLEITGTSLSLAPKYGVEPPYVHVRRLDDINLDNTYFSPRVSVSWDPWNDGKTRFGVTARRYYGALILLYPALENSAIRASVTYDAVQSGDRWVVPNAPSQFRAGLSTYQVSRDLSAPKNDEISFTVEREVWTESSIKFTYINRHYSDYLQVRDQNRIPLDVGRCQRLSTPGGFPVAAAPGVGDLVDPYTNQVYYDDDPGNGDGRVDDCTGVFVGVPGSPNLAGLAGLVPRPDGIPDLYTQNPLWGSISLLGNFNTGTYQAYQLEFVRRQYKNWQMEASYVWSKAQGDAEDFAVGGLGNDPTTIDQEHGYLGTDQRHVVKVNATTLTPWGIRLGSTVTWQSGLPWSILQRDLSFYAVPPAYQSLGDIDPTVRTRYPTGQRNDQRNSDAWNVDVKASKELSLPGKMNLQLTASIYNLLNDQTYRVYNDGNESGRQINGRNEAYRLDPRRFEIGFRLAF